MLNPTPGEKPQDLWLKLLTKVTNIEFWLSELHHICGGEFPVWGRAIRSQVYEFQQTGFWYQLVKTQKDRTMRVLSILYSTFS